MFPELLCEASRPMRWLPGAMRTRYKCGFGFQARATPDAACSIERSRCVTPNKGIV